MNKYASIIIIFLIAMILESLFKINVYFMIFAMALAFGCMWHVIEKRKEYETRKESMQLQNQINSTSKDAYLKNKQLITVMGNLPFPIMLMDQNGNIVMHNQLMEELSSSPLNDEVNYLRNNFPYEIQEFIKDAFILEKKLDQMITLQGIEYGAMSIPVTTKQKFSGCLLMLQDISKTLEGEKMQRRFIADASHELKTPIAVIKGMLEILNRPDFDDQKTEKEFLMQMEKETQRLETLVKDMLELSRLSVSKPILDRRKCDVCALLNNTIESFYKIANDKGITFTTQFDSNEEVFCDPIKMTQVFTNIISNAIKYSDSGNIHIHTYQEDPYYVVTIKDEGHGLTKDQQEKIFDRFYRVDKDRSRKSGGLGLGLAIVKSIMDAHSGKIEITSEIDEGTMFFVKLKN